MKTWYHGILVKLGRKRYLSVGQIANSGALQPSSGKNYILFYFNVQFPKDGQTFYTKPCQMIHVIFMNES